MFTTIDNLLETLEELRLTIENGDAGPNEINLLETLFMELVD